MSTTKKTSSKKIQEPEKPVITKLQILSSRIDEVIEKILEGATYRAMCKHFEVSMGELTRFFATPEHSARVAEALKSSADTYVGKAEEILCSLKSKATAGDIARCRELASHWRWAAKMRDKKKYGDRVDVTSGDKPITPSIIPTIQVFTSGPPLANTEDDIDSKQKG